MSGSEVQYEDWHVGIQIAAFTVIFIAFCYFSIRAFLMKKDKEDKMAAMPLEEEEEASSDSQSTKDPK